MTTKVVYVAKDGMEFDNAETCLEYEKNKSCVMCWDDSFSLLDESDYERAMFCANSAENLEYGILPRLDGAWVWFADDWVRCEEMIQMCQTAIKAVKEPEE